MDLQPPLNIQALGHRVRNLKISHTSRCAHVSVGVLVIDHAEQLGEAEGASVLVKLLGDPNGSHHQS